MGRPLARSPLALALVAWLLAAPVVAGTCCCADGTERPVRESSSASGCCPSRSGEVETLAPMPCDCDPVALDADGDPARVESAAGGVASPEAGVRTVAATLAVPDVAVAVGGERRPPPPDTPCASTRPVRGPPSA